jgi:hypothetical protein
VQGAPPASWRSDFRCSSYLPLKQFGEATPRADGIETLTVLISAISGLLKSCVELLL